MRCRVAALALIVTAPLFATSAVEAAAPLTHVACGQIVETSIRLANNLTCAGSGIAIAKSGVTLDLNGHHITRSPVNLGADDFGINVPAGSGIKDVTIKNGVVRGFEYNVMLGGDKGTLTNVVVVVESLGVMSGSSNTIKDNKIVAHHGTSTKGIVLVGLGKSVVSRNLISGTDDGVIVDSARNSVTGNSILGARSGITVSDDRNRVANNTVEGGGITVTGTSAEKNLISKNLVTRSEANGITVAGPGPIHNRIERNTVSYNSGHGIEVGESATTIVSNRALHNGTNGIMSHDGAMTTISKNTVKFNGASDNAVTSDHAGLGIQAPADVRGTKNKATGNDDPMNCLPARLCTSNVQPFPVDESLLACNTQVFTSIKLANNLRDCPASGLRVMASDITIDLNGHHISGLGNGAGVSNAAGTTTSMSRTARSVGSPSVSISAVHRPIPQTRVPWTTSISSRIGRASAWSTRPGPPFFTCGSWTTSRRAS